MKTNRRIVALILCLFLTALIPLNAFAQQIDTSKKGSLCVAYAIDAKAVSGVEFSIFHVAELSSDMKITYTDDFKHYKVNVDEVFNSGALFEAYVQVDGIAPAAKAKTNASGMATFNNLQPGVYLILGEDIEKDGYIYTATPTVVSVPGKVNADDEWNYDVIVMPKSEGIAVSPGGDDVPSGSDTPSNPPSDSDLPTGGDDIPSGSDVAKVKVLKVWEDEGNDDKRPESIEVLLIENGDIFDSVVLSEDNNWTYLWDGLDSNKKYMVIEKNVPEGYTVSLSREGISYVLTNTAEKKQPPVNPDDDEDLPQTGQLWWPVPILAVVGLALVVTGLAVRKEDGVFAD